MAAFSCPILGYFRERFRRDLASLEAEILVNNIFLYKLFIGVKKINCHSGVNFSFKLTTEVQEKVQGSTTACFDAKVFIYHFISF